MSEIPDRTTGPVWPGDKNKRGPGPYHIDTFSQCPQRAAFQYEARLQPVNDTKRDPADIGTLVHVGLAYRYAQMLPQRPAWMVYPNPYAAIEECGFKRPDLAAEAKRIFAWYEYTYQKDTLRPILVEHQFQAQLGDDLFMTARIDLLAEEFGQLVVVDHKVKGKLTKRTGDYASTDRQFVTLLALARASGFDIKRVMLNGMTRDFPTPQFRRFPVPVSAQAYERLGVDSLYYLRARNEIRNQFPDPMNRPRNFSACMTHFGLCPYDPLCRDGLHRLSEYTKT